MQGAERRSGWHRRILRTMKAAAIALACLGAFAGLGCAGLGGTCAGAVGGVFPNFATVETGGTVVFESTAFNCSSSLSTITWAVQEGEPGGTVEPFREDGKYFATYTAPPDPGTYHVVATAWFANGSAMESSSTVTVE